MWEKTKTILFWFVAGWFVLGLVIDGLSHRHVSEGDQCGPRHHWQIINNDANGGDLSCEPD